MGPASTITIKISPTDFVKQEGRTPPKYYTVKTMKQFIKTIDPQVDAKLQDLWQPALLAHEAGFVIRITKENAHKALERLTRHGFATTPKQSWQPKMGVLWPQDKTYADALRSATQTLTAVLEQNGWCRDSSLFLRNGTQRTTYGLWVPTEYMDLARASAGMDNLTPYVMTGCSHKWSKRGKKPATHGQVLLDATSQTPSTTGPTFNAVRTRPTTETAETRLLQENSWASIVKDKAQLTVEHTPARLNVNWGDIQDSDEEEADDAATQGSKEDQDLEMDMEEANDTRKRAGEDMPTA
eukprot:2979625-Amphidinium_carterae.1